MGRAIYLYMEAEGTIYMYMETKYLPVYGRSIYGYMGLSTGRWAYLQVDGAGAVYR